MNLEAIDLNLLHVLHVVLAERGVKAAAARLHVTSPAVSNALRRLRDLVGDPLFVRSGRGLVPTRRALELAPGLTRGFAELAGALRAGAFDPALSTRELTLALTDADQITSLPLIARRFGERMPHAHLRVVSVDVLVSTGGLAGTEVDLAIGPPLTGDGLHHALLYEESAVFVVRRDHPRIGRRLSKSRFGSERHVDVHIALGRGGAGHRVAQDAFARHGLSRDVAITVPTFAAAVFVAASTDLVAGVPRRVADALAHTLPIRIVPGPLPGFRFPIGMAWHERTHVDAPAVCLRKLVAEVLAPRRVRAVAEEG